MTGSSAQLPFPASSVTHAFRAPTDLCAATGNEPLLLELIGSRAFQRLKDIRFLGAIDYCQIPRPNGRPGVTRFSRYQHSLGVMQLAIQYCSARELSPTQRVLMCTAALLHDIGHPPLSHSIEPLFKEILGIDHHKASEDIICGRVSLGKDVYSILTRHAVNVDALLATISGATNDFEGFFDGPINFDTIEGILRCHNYRRGILGTHSPTVVMRAAIRRQQNSDRDIVDEFWRLKNFVYKNIINSPEGILSDFVCDLFLRRNHKIVNRELFFSTEKRLFELYPGLRKLLTSGTYKRYIARTFTAPIYFTERCYFVDLDGDFFGWKDDTRYKQTRCRRILDIPT